MQKQQWNGRKRKQLPFGLSKRAALTLAVCVVLIVIGVIGLIVRAAVKQASEKTDEEMRALYYQSTPIPTLTQAPTASPTPEPTPQPTQAPAGTGTSATTSPPMGVPRLNPVFYPNNPERSVSKRFVSLRLQNSDIIGWLSIGNMVDEAVVQRDNSFYMDHNVKGQQDVNGAIFLDAFISLDTRPYALILYGHNMRTGARFGSLQNFDNISFYRKYPFIDFTSIYEEGSYVIFSVGSVSTNENDPNFLDFFGLASNRKDKRRQAFETIQAVSAFTETIDVVIDDQILLLVTCEDKKTAESWQRGESGTGKTEQSRKRWLKTPQNVRERNSANPHRRDGIFVVLADGGGFFQGMTAKNCAAEKLSVF